MMLCDSPNSRTICLIERSCRLKIRISTACSWGNISAARNAAILSQVGQFYFGGVGQFYSAANTGTPASPSLRIATIYDSVNFDLFVDKHARSVHCRKNGVVGVLTD